MSLHFAEPGWIHLLWLVALLVGLAVALERRGRSRLERFLSATMARRLARVVPGERRLLALGLLGLSGVCLTIALMRPQWGLRFVATPRVGAEIMVCLDVSRSMLAEDAAPNRLERAKAEIRDLLTYLDGDRVGLIAFAGRATVLSPLTPDFGFLRLALDRAGPHSVTRGGTRLEEPIRKAVAGFRKAGEASRSILLITDGEDHDSFPLDAAREAAERGIRILAIGYGDENGSEIVMTDPATGVRSPLRDSAGNLVRSRLDGDLLRQLALETDGAYVPAATGVLDIESIYERHISGLTRGRLDGRSRSVRNDAYPWAILAGLVSLLASLAVARRAAPGAVVLLLTLLSPSVPASAEPAAAGPSGNAPQPESEAAAEATPAETAPTPTAEPENDNPRITYNEALEALRADELDRAERKLASARDRAGADGDLRFHATYNLGWLEARHGESLAGDSAETALAAFERAADWFREAAALRPADEDSKRNLEVVGRRILELRDTIAADDPSGMEAGLDALVESQRAFLGQLAPSVREVRDLEDEAAVERLRSALRALSIAELDVLGRAEETSQSGGDERDTLLAKAEAERTPEETLRAAQLEGALAHLHRARERMSQARGRLRRLEPEAAFRRASDALDELRLARDRLADPLAVLDRMIADGTTLLALTSGYTAHSAPAAEDSGAPTWLTLDYLEDRQIEIEARSVALHTGFENVATQDTAAGELPPEQAKFRGAVEEALPFLGAARERYWDARKALEEDRPADAPAPQRQALLELQRAREAFLDLRQLIDVAWNEQRAISALVNLDPEKREDAEDVPADAAEQVREIARGAEEAQGRNEARGERLVGLLADALASTNEPPADVPPEANQQNRARIEQAIARLGDAQTAMAAARASLADLASAHDPLSGREGAARVTEKAEKDLAALRRIFFDVVEHLRETLALQNGLRDETTEAGELGDLGDGLAEALGELAPRQDRLGERANGIAEALRQQSEAAAAQTGAIAGHDEAAGDQTEKLLKAGELVLQGAGSMATAAEALRAGDGPPSIEAQGAASSSLEQALALLQPPSDGEEDSSSGKEQQPQQEEQEKQTEQKEQAGPRQDPRQVLQGIRDRETERQDQRERADRARVAPVEKDW